MKKLKSKWLPKIRRKFTTREDQEDILQECFISYLRNRSTIEQLHPSQQYYYIMNIANTKMNDHLRKKIRNQNNSQVYTEEKKSESRLLIHEVFETESQLEAIRKQLKIKDDTPFLEYFRPYLTEDQYIAINLRVAEHSYEAIAQKMDKQTSQVKGLIERSRKKIRHLIHNHS